MSGSGTRAGAALCVLAALVAASGCSAGRSVATAPSDADRTVAVSTLAASVEAYLADDVKGAQRNLRSLVVSIAGQRVVERYPGGSAGDRWDVGGMFAGSVAGRGPVLTGRELVAVGERLLLGEPADAHAVPRRAPARVDGHAAAVASGTAGQLLVVVPDLGLVVAVQSRIPPSGASEPGTPSPDDYASLVAGLLAPALRPAQEAPLRWPA